MISRKARRTAVRRNHRLFGDCSCERLGDGRFPPFAVGQHTPHCGHGRAHDTGSWMKSLTLAISVATIAMSTVAAAAGDPWKSWERLSRARCPSQDVDWIANDSYLFLVERFDATL